MVDTDELLTMAAFVKWIRAEPLSREDIERVLVVMQKNDLKVSMIDAQTWAAMQVKIRHILNERFGGPKPEQSG